jgi:signal transduction histidine kinase
MSGPTVVEPRLRELVGGIAVLRLLVVVWAVVVTVVDARSGVLSHPTGAFAVLAVVAAWTGLIGVWVLTSPSLVVRPAVLSVDLVVGAAVVVADWLVYDGPHPQSFGSAWPVTSVVLVAVVRGWKPGLVAGLGLGLANVVAVAATDHLTGRGLALGGNVVLLATTGAVAGFVSTRLREAESAVAAARERERFARTLHDGVLQTLAVVQRRSDDQAIVELARDQEWELRRFIGSGPDSRTDLVAELRSVAARTERHHRVRVEVVVIEDPGVAGERLDALVGATTEAVGNAVKHASPSVVTVCLDAGEGGRGSLVTVTDDGSGFEVGDAPAGTGLTRSIRGRLSEVGGRATIRSTVGRGTEVSLWVP